jgi:hypothetical protein
MTETRKPLKVTSHVGRDLLAAAAVFKNEAAVVWEYVVNSLQYCNRGDSPVIQVDVDKKRRTITISDSSSGMDAEVLERFFQMHGENLERQSGRPGRGKFGTGDVAAFGIANGLRVETRKGGLRNEAILTREMIDKSSGEAIPVDWTIQDQACDEATGTVVEIFAIAENVKIGTPKIIDYIERHLQAFRSINPNVAVNNHLCSYKKLEISESRTFRPSAVQAKVIGDVELTVNVSKSPLDEPDHGVVVTAGVGNTVAIETAGVNVKELGSYLFGTIDVPKLEDASSPIEPYDATRSLELNPQHPIVQVLVPFIGSKLEAVRSELVQRTKAAQKDDQTRRLSRVASKIADILNDDFRKVQTRLNEIRVTSARPGSASAQFGGGRAGGDEADSFVEGAQMPGHIVKRNRKRPAPPDPDPLPGPRPEPRPDPNIPAAGVPDPDGAGTVDPAGGGAKKRRRPSGGFSVIYGNLGENEERSRYDSPALTIVINLDNNVVAAALGRRGTEDPSFVRLSYEIAFSEYAMGLGYEIVKQDQDIPADDVLYEVRSSLNRVASAAAELYR